MKIYQDTVANGKNSSQALTRQTLQQVTHLKQRKTDGMLHVTIENGKSLC